MSVTNKTLSFKASKADNIVLSSPRLDHPIARTPQLSTSVTGCLFFSVVHHILGRITVVVVAAALIAMAWRMDGLMLVASQSRGGAIHKTSGQFHE